jgi:signal transduction histidine kinase
LLCGTLRFVDHDERSGVTGADLSGITKSNDRQNVVIVVAVAVATLAIALLIAVTNLPRPSLALLTVLLGSGTLWALLDRERAARKRSAKMQTEFESILHSCKQLNRGLEAQRDAERDLLARELYSGIGQELTSLRFVFEHAMQRYEKSPELARETLATLRVVLGRCGATLDILVNHIRPIIVTEQGLASGLKWLCESVERGFDLPCALVVEGDLLRVQPAVQSAIFRVVQESLNNVVRHAKAKKASVLVRTDRHGLLVEVRDNGTGISPDSRSTARKGINSLRLRAQLLDGELAIKSLVEGGTLVRFTLRHEDAYTP